jgi:hypothetical protein
MKLLLLLLLCSFSSCATLYGVKNQKEFSPKKIQKFIDKHHLNNLESYCIDTNFRSFLKTKTLNTSEERFFSQPLQVHYFENDTLISSHVNCNVGGFPNLTWNKKGYFNVFPAVSQFKSSQIIRFSEMLPYFGSLATTKTKYTKYTVVVFWNLFLERQSKRLIKLVVRNIQKSIEPSKIILVNNDKLFIFK